MPVKNNSSTVPLICPMCNQTFNVSPFRVRQGAKYCSHQCQHVSMRGRVGSWNSGFGPSQGWIDADGYRMIRVNGRNVLEHRHVMEQHLGRSLRPDEVVHHVDGDRRNNAVSNLRVMDWGDHTALHWTGRSRIMNTGNMWSMNHNACVDCETTSKPHYGHGRCHACYKRWKRRML